MTCVPNRSIHGHEVPDRFGRARVTDPARTFTGFVTGDRRLVRAIAEHLETIGRP